MKKKLSLLFIASLLLLGSLYSYRLSLAQWSLRRYFQAKGIEAQFKITSLGFKEINIVDLKLDQNIFIEKISIVLAGKSLQSLEFSASQLDLNEIKKISTKFSGQTSKNEELNFKSLDSLCQTVKPLSINIEIENLVYNQKKIPIHLSLRHTKNENSTQVQLGGEITDLMELASYQVSAPKYQAHLNIDCLDTKINLTAKNFKVDLKNIESTSLDSRAKTTTQSKIKFKNTQIDFSEFQITFLQNDQFNLLSHFFLKSKISNSEGELISLSSPFSLNHQSLIGKWFEFKNQIKTNGLSLKNPVPIDIKKVSLTLENIDKDALNLHGIFNINGLTYYNENNEVFVDGINLKGQFTQTPEALKSNLNVTDLNQILYLNDISAQYDFLKNKMSFLMSKNNSIKLSQNISQLFPLYKSWGLIGDGKVYLNGQMTFKDNNWKGRLNLNGKGINLKSKFFDLTNANFENSIKQYPLLLTTPKQILNIKSFHYGPTEIENFKLIYGFKEINKAFINQLDFNFEKATLKASDFKYGLSKKRLEDFKLKISQYELEKVLKLPLGESVTAKGVLDGDLSVEYLNDIPHFKGELHAQKNGWIRYRKSILGAKDFKAFSANPMDILSRYLYDFYYEDLDLEFSSDAKYDMKMTMRTLGKNPQYLSGKPLKLNLNLEQNLLAAFKAMMLTYDLPKRIEEKIEKLGEK